MSGLSCFNFDLYYLNNVINFWIMSGVVTEILQTRFCFFPFIWLHIKVQALLIIKPHDSVQCPKQSLVLRIC